MIHDVPLRDEIPDSGKFLAHVTEKALAVLGRGARVFSIRAVAAQRRPGEIVAANRQLLLPQPPERGECL